MAQADTQRAEDASLTVIPQPPKNPQEVSPNVQAKQ